MADVNNSELKEVDSDDISYVLSKLEKSFGIKYQDNAFRDVRTFGDICDVIERHIEYQHQDSCTTQQAFYKVRNAIISIVPLLNVDITPETKLETLFPRGKRRKNVKMLTKAMNVKVDLLGMNGWVVITILSGFLVSLIALFFSWKIAVAGFLFFYLAFKIADQFSKELMVETVGELSQKLTREQYIHVRRQTGTMNRKEVTEVIIDAFSSGLYIDREYLTQDASLGLD